MMWAAHQFKQLLKAPWFQVGSSSSLNIFHKKREISILLMKKKPTATGTLLQEATERSKIGKTKKKTKNSVTAGNGQWKTPTCEPISAASPEATGRLSHTAG
jgi:hypothetical protein